MSEHERSEHKRGGAKDTGGYRQQTQSLLEELLEESLGHYRRGWVDSIANYNSLVM